MICRLAERQQATPNPEGSHVKVANYIIAYTSCLRNMNSCAT